MGYGINHYTYQNIVDPNRPRPVKPPSKVPPRMTDAQKADALARILAVKTEIETREAEAVAKVTAAREKVMKAATDTAPEAVPDLAEAKKVLRDAQLRAARTKYREKMTAEEDAARDALVKLRLADDRKRKKGYRTAKVEERLVADYRAGLPTARELVNEAQIAALIERVEARKARIKEKSRRQEIKRRERRQAARAERLTAEAEAVDEKLRAYLVTPDDVIALEAYLARSQECRNRYYHTVGRPLSEAEETQKERAVKSRLLKRLEENPKFLDDWKAARWLQGIGTLSEEQQTRRRLYYAEKNARTKNRRLDFLLGRREEVEARIAELSEMPERKWAIAQLIRTTLRYSQRYRKQANLPPWTEEQLELAVLRAKIRIVDRVAVEADYLDLWYTKEKRRRSQVSKRKIERIKEDPVRARLHRQSVNLHRNEWRHRKRREKLAAEAANPPAPVEPVVDEAVYQRTLRRLTRIFEKARRDAAKREK